MSRSPVKVNRRAGGESRQLRRLRDSDRSNSLLYSATLTPAHPTVGRSPTGEARNRARRP